MKIPVWPLAAALLCVAATAARATEEATGAASCMAEGHDHFVLRARLKPPEREPPWSLVFTVALVAPFCLGYAAVSGWRTAARETPG